MSQPATSPVPGLHYFAFSVRELSTGVAVGLRNNNANKASSSTRRLIQGSEAKET